MSPVQASPGARGSRDLRRRAAGAQRRVSLCETLDRVLNKGAVVTGDVIISIAGVDLIYLGLHLVVSSVETMRRHAVEGRRPTVGALAAGALAAPRALGEGP